MLTKRDQMYIEAEIKKIAKYLQQEAGPGMNKFSEITPHIYITNWDSACNPHNLKDKSIELVILVSKDSKSKNELRLYNSMRIQQEIISLDDDPKANINNHFDKFYNILYNAILEEKNVLVHCETGISSSVALVLFYLLKRYYMTNFGKKPSLDAELVSPKFFKLKNIIEYMKDRRQCADPNMGFVAQLLTAELFLKKRLAAVYEERAAQQEKAEEDSNEEFAEKRERAKSSNLLFKRASKKKVHFEDEVPPDSPKLSRKKYSDEDSPSPQRPIKKQSSSDESSPVPRKKVSNESEESEESKESEESDSSDQIDRSASKKRQLMLKK